MITKQILDELIVNKKGNPKHFYVHCDENLPKTYKGYKIHKWSAIPKGNAYLGHSIFVDAEMILRDKIEKIQLKKKMRR